MDKAAVILRDFDSIIYRKLVLHTITPYKLDLDHADFANRTLLMLYCEGCSTYTEENLHFLVTNTSKVNQKSCYSNTVLQMALLNEQLPFSACLTLLQNGVKCDPELEFTASVVE